MDESTARAHSGSRNLNGENSVKEECCVCLGEFQKYSKGASNKTAIGGYLEGLELFNHLSSYFNESEENTRLERREENDGSVLPKLIYTLITKWSSVPANKVAAPLRKAVCVGCHKELSKLEELHQRFQSIKKAISNQVQAIKEKSVKQKDQQNPCSSIKNMHFWRRKTRGSSVEKVVGSSSGYGNVCSTLRFLASLCDDLAANHNHDDSTSDAKKGISSSKKSEYGMAPLSVVDYHRQLSTPSAESSSSSSSPGYSPITPQTKCHSPSSSLPEPLKEPPHIEEFLEIKTEVPENAYSLQDQCDNQDFSLAYFEGVSDPLEEQEASSSSEYNPTNHRRNKVRKRKPSSCSSNPDSYNSYKCQTCQKTFTKKTILQIHQRIHSGLKPYECKLCNMRFTQNGGLAKHMVTHTGEKKYICNVCDRRFTQGGALRRHMKLQHQIT